MGLLLACKTTEGGDGLHVRKMDFTGRPMSGYVFVDPPGIERDEDLARWLWACLTFVRTLPPVRLRGRSANSP